MASSIIGSQSFQRAKKNGHGDYFHGQSVRFYENGHLIYSYFQNVLLWSNSGKPFDPDRHKTFIPQIIVDIDNEK